MSIENLESKAKTLVEATQNKHLRVSGEPYSSHVSKVVRELKSLGITDDNILAFAYLHHVPYFEENWYPKLAADFNDEIADLCKRYREFTSKPLPTIEPNHTNEKVILQTFLNLINDPVLLLVRIIDRAENIKTAHLLPADKREKIAYKALYIYSPVCQLLGFYKYVRILEDNAFKLLNPHDYHTIRTYMDKVKTQLDVELTETRNVVSEFLTQNDIEHEIKFRVKHPYSIYKKINKKFTVLDYKALNEIKDLAAIRVLVKTVEDCYKTEGILHELFESFPKERDDYIAKPKASGYKSLHNVFRISPKLDVEIQIRTYDMHEYNEFGVGSHFIYKTGKDFTKLLLMNPEMLKELNYFEGREVKIDHFHDFVYVFTPLGDIIELPKGSNLIDFAYAIHYELGNRCIGALVNKELQKLTYELKDGDYVEIRTSNTKKNPSIDWLKTVKTKRARDSITKALKQITTK